MARRDGEFWLEGRPVESDDVPAEEARKQIAAPSWWAIMAVASLIAGALVEAAFSLLGDGTFAWRDAGGLAAGIYVATIVGTAIQARSS